FNQTAVICVSYAYGRKGKVQHLIFDLKSSSQSVMFNKLSKLINDALYVIGKNSDRFDTKHIHTNFMLNNIKNVLWINQTDDLEKQMRRYFTFPSMSLEYLAQILVDGKKDKMEWSDWQYISWMYSIASTKGLSSRAKDLVARRFFSMSWNELVKRGNFSLRK